MYSIFDEEKLEEFRKQEKLQPFRIKQIYNNIFKNSVIDFDDMTDLSKDLRKKLKGNFYILNLKPLKVLDGPDTTKISFQTKEGYIFESVLMYHWHEKDNGEKKLNRITICVSSQIGCAVGCRFCVTGKMGFIKNLSYDEILQQILWANNYIKQKFGKKEDKTWWKIRNVVFMGMGEPMLNYDEVKKSIGYMLDQKKLNLSKRHITISTSGIVPGIYKMLEDKLDVMLAISLHSAEENVRSEIMPITHKYPLSELMEALDKYVEQTNNRVFYEYIMIKDLTDTLDAAKALAKLLKGRLAHVNLIPYNENPVVDYETSPEENIKRFKDYLENEGITVTVRQTMGEEQKGACGQLGYEIVKKSRMTEDYIGGQKRIKRSEEKEQW